MLWSMENKIFQNFKLPRYLRGLDQFPPKKKKTLDPKTPREKSSKMMRTLNFVSLLFDMLLNFDN